MPFAPTLSISHTQTDGIYYHKVCGLWLVCCVCIDPENMTMKTKRTNTWGLSRPLTMEVI
jgi:hypothetical protein